MGINEAALADRIRREAQEEKMPVIANCIQCGRPIFEGTETLEGDDYVETEDGPVHWDCWDDYGRSVMKHG